MKNSIFKFLIFIFLQITIMLLYRKETIKVKLPKEDFEIKKAELGIERAKCIYSFHKEHLNSLKTLEGSVSKNHLKQAELDFKLSEIELRLSELLLENKKN